MSDVGSVLLGWGLGQFIATAGVFAVVWGGDRWREWRNAHPTAADRRWDREQWDAARRIVESMTPTQLREQIEASSGVRTVIQGGEMHDARPEWMRKDDALREIQDVERRIGDAAMLFAEAPPRSVLGDQERAEAESVFSALGPRLRILRREAGLR